MTPPAPPPSPASTATSSLRPASSTSIIMESINDMATPPTPTNPTTRHRRSLHRRLSNSPPRPHSRNQGLRSHPHSLRRGETPIPRRRRDSTGHQQMDRTTNRVDGIIDFDKVTTARPTPACSSSSTTQVTTSTPAMPVTRPWANPSTSSNLFTKIGAIHNKTVTIAAHVRAKENREDRPLHPQLRSSHQVAGQSSEYPYHQLPPPPDALITSLLDRV